MPKIYAISDLHGNLDDFRVPACDILLIAGDILPDIVKRRWVRRDPGLAAVWMAGEFTPWLRPYLDEGWVKHVVLTWGNHDWTQTLKKESFLLPPNVHILVDEEITIDNVRIWGSPWSNSFNGWAWMKDPDQLKPHYDLIPEGIDIIMSHQPPSNEAGFLGEFVEGPRSVATGLQLGSVELLERIRVVRPKAVVCGHIHAAHGIYPADLITPTTTYNVAMVDEAYCMVHAPTEILL